MRLFVAIEVPESWRAEGTRIQKAFPSTIREQTRLVDAANMHITLRFIGEVDEPALPALRSALAHARLPVAITLALAGIGTFGAPARTSVVWLGIGGDLNGLRSLARCADGAVVTALELPAETRAYHPHITLARVRQQVPADERRVIATAMGAIPPPSALPFVAHEVVLIRSHLDAQGARYEVLERWG